ncbi:STAS domain-containing protein [Streptomyces sp. NPDC093546]|uniref:STAS domain-containing protein n=1 Tax=Streptomyces sp. NPDC093546 TaxID=3366040 RepID=UPI003822A101
MGPSRVQVRVEPRPAGIGVVTISGELDYDGISAFEQALTAAQARGMHQLLLDLSPLTFMDSSGVNAFLRAQRATTTTGGWLRLANAQPSVLKVIELVGLGQAIPLYGTVEEALEA